MANPNDGVQGFQELNTPDGGFNSLSFVIDRALSKLNTATLVKVEAVHSNGVGAAGTVDVTPLVNQVTGDGQAVPHTTLYGLPFFRPQGGENALIIDPVAGDVGYCVFADHDISAVKKARGRANPGSRRRFNWADGLYLGAWSNIVPTRYILITPDRVKIEALTSPLELDSPIINLLQGAAVIQVAGVQVLKARQSGVGATPPAYTLTGTYSTDVSHLQLSIDAIRLEMAALKNHGLVAT